jgi:hypothetical protein
VGEVFVVNASPVITLAKAGHLILLTDLADTVLVPDAVVFEVLAGAESDPARQVLEGGGVRGCSSTAYQQPCLKRVLGKVKPQSSRER